MVIAHSKFSLGLPTPQGESRIWERAENGVYACILYVLSGKSVREQARETEVYISQNPPSDVQSLFELLSTITTRNDEHGILSAVMGVLIEGDSLSVAAINGGVFLIRGTKRGTLLAPKPELQVIQGTVRTDDVLVLYSGTVEKQIQLLLTKGFAFDQVQTLAQAFERTIRRMDNSEMMAAGFIYNSGETEEAVEEAAEQAAVVGPSAISKLISSLKQIPGIIFKIARFTTVGLLTLLARLLRKKPRTETFASADERPSGAKNMLRSLIHPKKTYVGAHISRKQLVLILLFLFITLCGTVAIVFLNAKNTEIVAQVDQQLAPYQQQLNTLEQQSQQEPAQAYIGIQQLIQDLTVLETTYAQPVSAHKKILETLQSAQTLAQKLLEAQEVDQLPIYDDLRKISPTFVTSAITTNATEVVALDEQQQYLIRYSLDTKTGTQIALDSSTRLRNIVGLDSSVLGLGDGIFVMTGEGEASAIDSILESSTDITNSQLIGSYQDYVYLLNPVGRVIYRYERGPTALRNRTAWIGSSSGVPFSDVTSMVVDGSIWLGTKDGRIIQLRSGKVVQFDISGLSEPPDSTVHLATKVDDPYLYVLEPAKKRVFVVEKETGEVAKQVQNTSLGSATQIIFDSVAQAPLVVSGSLLYSLPL
ncbi:hypothetical protein KC921_02955 [Candidatus Woesebacteria bacterium]|nr:hypothetical protein [Candidatus Woesebacteria bacterium]